MKQKADRKKAIRRLTALSSRLQMLGVVLAVVGIMSAVQLPRTEVFAKPEPSTEPTQIEITEETTIPATTVAAETSAATEQTSAAETTVAAKSQLILGSQIMAAEEEAKGKRIEEERKKREQADDTSAKDISAIHEGLPWPPPREHVLETEPTVPELLEEPEKPVSLWLILTIVSDGLLILDLIAIAVVQKKLKKLRKGPDVIPTTERIPWHAVPPEIGKVHGIGGRDYQQDSLGHTRILNGSGILAIVADGMGGLSNGEQVSQQIVMDGLGYGAAMTGLSEGNPLLGMVGQINTNVNRMLGPEGIYKCGSTLIAVLVAQDQFHWVSVGDSRIYLYREGYVNQLNTDHDLFQQWMPEILAGTRSYVEAARNPDGRKLTSFIGMGELKYVDYSRQPIDLRQGDRLVLVTDGVYGTVPPEQLADILKANPEVSDAAKVLERRIRDARIPHQDNYTALILGF